jgi:hypothetical protein
VRRRSGSPSVRARLVRGPLLVAVAVAVAVAAVLCPAPAALAHGTDPTLVPVIDSISPALPAGVVVQVRTGVSEQMLVANPARDVLTVLDPDGTAFLKVSSAGVLGNLADPFFSETLNPPDVPPRLPTEARPGAKPHWVQVSQTDAFGWFEPRLHPLAPGTEPNSTIVARWTIGMRMGSVPVTIMGALERKAVTGTFVAEPDPRRDDLQLTVSQGRVPALLLVAPPGRTVVVLGEDGKDFLRLDAEGAWANTESRNFRDNIDFTDQAEGRTGWVRVGESGRVRWLDTRLQYSADRPPAVVEREGKTAQLGRWTIPLRLDGASAQLGGTISWLPNNALPRKRSDGALTWVVASGAVVLVGIAVLAVVGRRRRGRPGEPAVADAG